MANNREINSTLLAMLHGLRSIRIAWIHARDMIVTNQLFEREHWQQVNYDFHRAMGRLVQQYQEIPNHNVILIGYFRVFNFYWEHVIDCFQRETPQWRINNIALLNERIEQSELLEEQIREEMRGRPCA